MAKTKRKKVLRNYTVWGSTDVGVSADIEAYSEEEALARAEELSPTCWEFNHSRPEGPIHVDSARDNGEVED